MKRISIFLAFLVTVLVFCGCILSSSPSSSTISLDENGTQTFSVMAYGSTEWFVNNSSTGERDIVFEYSPAPGSSDQTHIIEARTSLEGRIYTKQWTVNIFGCDTGSQDTGTTTIENANDLSNLAGYTSVTGDLIIRQDKDLSSDDDDLIITNLDALECLHQINGNLTIEINPDLRNIDGLRYLTEVSGDVIIRSNRIDSVNLSGLTTIGNELLIQANATLSSLSGITSLTSVGSNITISANGWLLDVAALKNLESINGTLTIEDNVLLANVDDLIDLRSISGDFIIRSNYYLSKITPYYLDTIGGNLIIQNNMIDIGMSNDLNLNFGSLTSLGGGIDISNNAMLLANSEVPITMSMSFTDLTTIPGNLIINNNAALAIVGEIINDTSDGFPSLLDINGNLDIKTNNTLNILTFPVLEAIDANLSIVENISLPKCWATLIVDQATIGGKVDILGNLDDGTACENNCIDDSDNDSIMDCIDNCVDDSNPLQSDSDEDGVGNVCDNCENIANSAQTDSDFIEGDGNSDKAGDACDECPNDPDKVVPGDCGCGVEDSGDGDTDLILDCIDNCPADANSNQADSDRDGVGNMCDNCEDIPNARQDDADNNNIGDACENGCPNDPTKTDPGFCGCGTPDTDSDNDLIPDCLDNCPSQSNTGQTDADSDGFGDYCDNCPAISNHDQADSDGDGIGNACDNCEDTPNYRQLDTDGDGVGDACEEDCPNDDTKTSPGVCGCGTPDTDSDGDGAADCIDNCPTRNPDQSDLDSDGYGDRCDLCPTNYNPAYPQADTDEDGVGNLCDNCEDEANANQSDEDGDDIGDACDDCPGTVLGASVDVNGCSIAQLNEPPVASNDSISTNEDIPVNATLSASDTNGNSLTFSIISNGTLGTAVITDASAGTYTYTPNMNANGSDSFMFNANDGMTDSNLAVIAVTINPDNDAPIISGTPTNTINQGVSYSFTPIASDPDGDTLYYYCANNPSWTEFNQNTGTLYGTPANDDVGTITGIVISVSDGQQSTELPPFDLEVVNVNDPPIADNDSASTFEDEMITIGVLSNDTDDDGNPLTIISVTQGANGTVAITPDGTLIEYTPQLNFNGTDSFNYTVVDGNGGEDTAIVNVNITAQNDAPIANADTASTAEDTTVTISVLANDYDADGNQLSIATINLPTSGSASTNGTSIIYIPDPDFSGLASFTYTATDGFSESDIATVSISVSAQNDAPVATHDTASTSEDTPITFNVIENDTDPDGDILSVNSVTQGTYGSTVIDADTVSVTYSPTANYYGSDSFNYTVSDGNGGTSTMSVTVTIVAVNDAPVASADIASTVENTPVEIYVLANDTDDDNNPLIVSTATQPVITSGSGTAGTIDNKVQYVIYTPGASFNGTVTFEYTASDTNATNTATVTVTVGAVNDPPVANGDTESTDEDTPVTIDVLANDTDIDTGDTLTITMVTSASSGLVTQSPPIIYTPSANFNGQDSFTYTISDGNGGTDTATVNIIVSPINDLPVTVDDNASTSEDTTVNINVLSNDYDDDDDTLTISSVTPGTNGSVTINGTEVIYTPNSNFNGIDTFTYFVYDGQGTVNANVTVNVNSVNDIPSIENDSTSTTEDTPVTINVLTNDSDADGDTLTIDSITQGTGGLVTIISETEGTLLYTPQANFNGTYSFTYTARDGNNGMGTATVTIPVTPVNDPPNAENDNTVTQEDTPVTISVLSNDTDADSDDTLNIDSVIQGSNGSVSININSVVYTPNAGYSGTDSFTYTVRDSAGTTDTATVFITISSENDPPVAVFDSANVNEDTTVSINVIDNDTDADNDILTIDSVTQGTNGTVDINGTSVDYTPNANFNGVDNFSYIVRDEIGATDTATVTVNVASINDTPVANYDSDNTPEDTVKSIPVLDNDFDVDNDDMLSISSVTQGNTGSVSISGTVVDYTPLSDFNGTDTFTYTISDGNATATTTVSIVITPVNDAPVANYDSANTSEDTSVDIPVLANDTDADTNDTLSIASLTQSANGSVSANDSIITYTPNSNFNGSDSFTYTINDGNGGTDTADVSVNVGETNDPPSAVNDNTVTEEDTAVTINVLLNDTDNDGDTLSVISVSQGSIGSVAIDGTLVIYTPQANLYGDDTFTYTASDGRGGSAIASVAVTVNAVNDMPVANADTANTSEDTSVTINALDNDTDADGDSLIITSATNGDHGTVAYDTASVSYTPETDFNGTDTVTYSISDGNGGTDTANVTISVGAANDPPLANDDSVVTTEDISITIAVLSNDTDNDGDELSVTSVTNGTNGSAVINGTSVDYIPNLNFNGSDNFSYTVNDGNGGTDTATVSVSINAANDLPDITSSATTTATEETAYTYTPTATDPDGDTMTWSLTDEPSGMTVNIDTGYISWTPAEGVTTSGTITLTVSDGNGGEDTETFTISVSQINDVPVTNDDNLIIPEDTSATIAVLSNDTDADGDSLSVASVTDPENGSANINGTQVVYTPDANFNGTNTFNYTASDGKGGTNTAVVTITVNAVNDAPIAIYDTANTSEDTPVDISVLSNDMDVDTGDTLFIDSLTPGTSGSAAINGTMITYTPNTDFNGIDTIAYTVSDGNGGTDTANVTVNVGSANDPPQANEDSVVTPEDVSITIDVLSNDTDNDNDTLSVASVTNGTNGNAIINGTSVDYIPNLNFNGSDSFNYTASDGNGGTDTTTVSVNINAVNDLPVITSTATTTATEEVTYTYTPTVNDPDGDIMTWSIANEPSGMTVSSVTGAISWTPAEGVTTSGSTTLTVNDGHGGTSTEAFTIIVNQINDIPIVTDDSSSTAEDTTVTINVLANDSDNDGDPLTITSVTQGTNGTVTISNNSVVYTPDLNFNGLDSFNYTVSDGNLGSNTATVSITVSSANDVPIANDDNTGTPEDTLVSIYVLNNDTDADLNDTLSITSVTQGSNGTVAINGTSVDYLPYTNYNGSDSFTYSMSDGNGGMDSAIVTVNVSMINDQPDALDDNASTAEDTLVTINVLANDVDVDVDDTLNISTVTSGSNGATVTINGTSVDYTPAAQYNGTDSFTYTINDGNGGTDTATVTVNVGSTNDAPNALDDSASTSEDTPITVDVLDNDSDNDVGDNLSIVSFTQGSNGSTGIYNTSIEYTPQLNYNGNDSFTYTISDGNGGMDTATVTISVTAVNDAPDAVDDNASTSEDTVITVQVTENDIDDDGDPLNITSITQGDNGSVVIDGTSTIYTPNTNYNGSDNYNYTISDGNGGIDTATVTVNIGEINDIPIAIDDNASTPEDTLVTIPVLDNDTDSDGDSLIIYSVIMGDNGTASINGTSVNYLPDAHFNGIDTFTYTTSDGNGGMDTATVTVNVSSINDLPVANVDSITISEDTTVTIDVLSNDTDADNDTLNVASVSDPANGSANISGTFVIYTPDPEFSGTDNFSYSASDGNGGTDSATVTVTVTIMNDAPVANYDTASTSEDVAVDINVLANDTDADIGDTLFIDSLIQGTNGSAVINGLAITYTPNSNFSGIDTFTYTVSDGNGGTDTADVTVNVGSANDPPDAMDDNGSTPEETSVTINVLFNDTDSDNDTISVVSITQGTRGSVYFNGSDATYTPELNYFGPDTFTYTISDGNGGTDTATVTISVIEINDPPVITSTATTTATEDVQYIYTPTVVDPDPNTMTWSLSSIPTGMAIDSSTGIVTWTPLEGVLSSGTVTMTVSDNNGGTDTETFTISVTPINDPPAISTTAETSATEDNLYTYVPEATDAEGDTLTWSLIDEPLGMDILDGTITWTPLEGVITSGVVTLTVDDGNGGSDTEAFTITVTQVNDSPVITSTASASATEDVEYTYSPTATDPEGDSLTWSLTNAPSGMTIIPSTGAISWTPAQGITTSGAVTLTADDGNGGSDTETFTVSVVAVNDPPVITSTATTSATEDVEYTYSPTATDPEGDSLTWSLTNAPSGMTIIPSTGAISWTPAQGVTTSGAVTLTADDGNGGSDTETFTIAVSNDPPVITSTAPASATEDVEYTYNPTATDPEGDSLTWSLTNAPSGMTINSFTGAIFWIPTEGITTSGIISLTVDDGNVNTDNEIFEIFVTQVNDAPVITSTASTSATEDVEYTYTPTATDPEGDSLTWSLSSEPSGMTINPSTGAISWTPAQGVTTSESVTLTADDGNGGSDTETFTIAVSAVNDPPVITSTATTSATEDVEYTYNPTATDPEGDSLTWSLSNEPSGMTIIPSTGAISWTPAQGVTTSESVTLTADDGNGGSDTETFTIAVSAVNDPPVITSSAPASATEDVVYTYNPTATDPEGDSLTWSFSNEPSGMTINPSTGAISWTPAQGVTTSGPVTLTADDGNGGSDTETFTIAVSAVNDPPVITSTAPASATEDVEYTYNPTATDPEGDSLTWSFSNEPSGMTINASTGMISWTPLEGVTTSGSVILTADDGNGGSDTETFTVAVSAVNDPPTITSTAPTSATEESEYTYNPTATDPEGNTPIWSLTNSPSGMSINSSTGAISWTPAQGVSTSGQVTLTVNDGFGGSDTELFTISVEPKASCGAVPMYRDNVVASDVSIMNSFSKASLPLIPALISLLIWAVAGRKNKGSDNRF